MRLGFVGPAAGDLEALRRAVEFLVDEAAVDQVVYLGNDDAAERIANDARMRIDRDGERTFEDRAAEIALRGSASDIESVVGADVELERLAALRTVPQSPSRAIEMLDDRIVLMVYDKTALDEDDIANASVIVYGQSKEMLVKRFGQRAFFTPGPLAQDRVGILEHEEDGKLALSIFDTSGTPILRESLAQRSTKLTVSQ
jgi:hypothetical protein